MKWITRSALLIVLVLLIIGSWAYQGDISADVIEQEFSDEQSKFVMVDETRTHYKIEGRGPAILLLHGTASSLHTWDAWTKELAKQFTVVRLDLPAFGLTGATIQRDYSLDFYVDFIHQFTKSINLSRFSLAGNSLGGGIAWAYAAENPQQIEKLILLDASGFPKQQQPIVFTLANNPLTASILRSLTPKLFIQNNLQQVYHRDELITDEIVDRYWRLSLREGSRQAFVDRVQTSFAYPIEKLSSVTAPTLIQWGQHDTWIDVSDAQKFAQKLVNSDVKIYPNVGHVPMEEAPQQTVADAITFLMVK